MGTIEERCHKANQKKWNKPIDSQILQHPRHKEKEIEEILVNGSKKAKGLRLPTIDGAASESFTKMHLQRLKKNQTKVDSMKHSQNERLVYAIISFIKIHHLLSLIVCPEVTSFNKSHFILDNIIVVQEGMEWACRSKKQTLFLKI